MATKKTNKKKKEVSVGKVMTIGAGLAALSAGAYYFLGPNGKKNQKHAKAWMNEMEKEAEKKLVKIKKVTTPLYHKAVDGVASMYTKEYKKHTPEIIAFAKKLKGEWKNVKKISRPVVKKVVKSTKKLVKKVQNKAVKARKSPVKKAK